MSCRIAPLKKPPPSCLQTSMAVALSSSPVRPTAEPTCSPSMVRVKRPVEALRTASIECHAPSLYAAALMIVRSGSPTPNRILPLAVVIPKSWPLAVGKTPSTSPQPWCHSQQPESRLLKAHELVKRTFSVNVKSAMIP